MNRIYADNAATTRPTEAALSAARKIYSEAWANPSSVHADGLEAKRILEQCREECARLLNCEPDEIIFTSGGTESDNTVIQSTIYRYAHNRPLTDFCIITSEFEHHAILHPLEKDHPNIIVYEIAPFADGIIDQADIDPDNYPYMPALISIMYAQNEIGTIQPIREIAQICRKNEIPFHTDAVQAVGHIPVDIKRDGMDMLSASAHKFGGIRGAGILFVRNGIPFFPLLTGGAQEGGRRAGTENLPAIAAMTAALKEATEAMEYGEDMRIARMSYELIEGLLDIPGTTLNGYLVDRLPGNVNISFTGIEGQSLLAMLDANGISASTGSACTSGQIEPSHVLKAIGRTDEEAKSAIRFSLGYDNTEKEVAEIIRVTKESVNHLRKLSPCK